MDKDNAAGQPAWNIWAPWRMEYIDSLGADEQGCFLCRHRDQADRDAENLVIWRGTSAFAMLNRFPYASGHCMVAPYEHAGDLGDLDAQVMRELMEHVRDLQRLLSHVVRAQGFNIGMNIGRCAGAGLPGHLHVHVVPRWEGDTNFMPVLGRVRVMPQALSDLYAQLVRAAAELKLPNIS